MDYQNLWDQNGRLCLCSLLRPGWPPCPTFSGLFYKGFYAHQVALPGRSLVFTQLPNVSVIRFILKLEEVQGHNGLHSMEGWSPNNYVVGHGYVNYQKVSLKTFELALVTKAHWEADHACGIHFLPSEA